MVPFHLNDEAASEKSSAMPKVMKLENRSQRNQGSERGLGTVVIILPLLFYKVVTFHKYLNFKADWGTK